MIDDHGEYKFWTTTDGGKARQGRYSSSTDATRTTASYGPCTYRAPKANRRTT